MGRGYQGRLPGGGGPLVDSGYSDRLLRDGEKKLVSMHFGGVSRSQSKGLEVGLFAQRGLRSGLSHAFIQEKV